MKKSVVFLVLLCFLCNILTYNFVSNDKTDLGRPSDSKKLRKEIPSENNLKNINTTVSNSSSDKYINSDNQTISNNREIFYSDQITNQPLHSNQNFMTYVNLKPNNVYSGVDLIVDNNSTIITTAQTYSNIIVKNNSNLTITNENVRVNNVSVSNNSVFIFDHLYINGSFSVSRNSNLIGSFNMSSIVFPFNIDNSTVTISNNLSTTTIDNFNITNSIVYFRGIKLEGTGQITNSNVIVVEDQDFSGFNLVIVDSEVNLTGINSLLRPIVYNLQVINSNVYMNEISISGDLLIMNSTMEGIDAVSFLHSFNVSDSTINFTNSFPNNGWPNIFLSFNFYNSVIYLKYYSFQADGAIINSTIRGIIGGDSPHLAILNSIIDINHDNTPFLLFDIKLEDTRFFSGNLSLSGSVVAKNSTFSGDCYSYYPNIINKYPIDLTSINSVINLKSSSPLSTPFIKNFNFTNSEVNLNGFDLTGSGEIENSTVNGFVIFAHKAISPDYFYDHVTITCKNSNLSLANSPLKRKIIFSISVDNSNFSITGFRIASVLITNSNGSLNDIELTNSSMNFINSSIEFDSINCFIFDNQNFLEKNTSFTFNNTLLLLLESFTANYKLKDNIPYLESTVRYLGSDSNLLELYLDKVTNSSTEDIIKLDANSTYFFKNIQVIDNSTYTLQLLYKNNTSEIKIGPIIQVIIPKINSTTSKSSETKAISWYFILLPLAVVVLIKLKNQKNRRK